MCRVVFRRTQHSLHCESQCITKYDSQTQKAVNPRTGSRPQLPSEPSSPTPPSTKKLTSSSTSLLGMRHFPIVQVQCLLIRFVNIRSESGEVVIIFLRLPTIALPLLEAFTPASDARYPSKTKSYSTSAPTPPATLILMLRSLPAPSVQPISSSLWVWVCEWAMTLHLGLALGHQNPSHGSGGTSNMPEDAATKRARVGRKSRSRSEHQNQSSGS